mmetsp:Transcript_29094/g.100343  ORF Transcript_29094/g.100343 Transcript_29094/m.100343 type:complete len:452 (+) Transcript_29094:11-1366(+)
MYYAQLPGRARPRWSKKAMELKAGSDSRERARDGAGPRRGDALRVELTHGLFLERNVAEALRGRQLRGRRAGPRRRRPLLRRARARVRRARRAPQLQRGLVCGDGPHRRRNRLRRSPGRARRRRRARRGCLADKGRQQELGRRVRRALVGRRPRRAAAERLLRRRRLARDDVPERRLAWLGLWLGAPNASLLSVWSVQRNGGSRRRRCGGPWVDGGCRRRVRWRVAARRVSDVAGRLPPRRALDGRREAVAAQQRVLEHVRDDGRRGRATRRRGRQSDVREALFLEGLFVCGFDKVWLCKRVPERGARRVAAGGGAAAPQVLSKLVERHRRAAVARAVHFFHFVPCFLGRLQDRLLLDAVVKVLAAERACDAVGARGALDDGFDTLSAKVVAARHFDRQLQHLQADAALVRLWEVDGVQRVEERVGKGAPLPQRFELFRRVSVRRGHFRFP